MNQCPDPETLAAWADQGLDAGERSRVESHAAGCARCQAQLAAMARMAAADPAIVPQSSMQLWRWLVPATAGAAAVALWVLVQPPQAPVPPPPAEAVQDRSSVAPASPPADLSKPEVDQGRANEQLMARTRRLADERREDKLKEKLEETTVTSAPAAAAPPARAEEAMSSLAARFVDRIEIVSPDPAIRWRVSGSAVERSIDAGLTWQSQSIGLVAELTAGASPSATVAWLVGRAGVIVLSTDGLTWRRVPFPETIHLTGVHATDASHATVTTADGRTFSTSDAATWVRR